MNREQVQEHALSILKHNHRCSLGISMGVGKTRIAYKHMLGHYNSFAEYLVVAPKHSIIKTWIDESKKIGCEELLQHITLSMHCWSRILEHSSTRTLRYHNILIFQY